MYFNKKKIFVLNGLVRVSKNDRKLKFEKNNTKNFEFLIFFDFINTLPKMFTIIFENYHNF